MELPTPAPMQPFRKLRDGLMFLPLISYTDGYGLSYGAQFSFADVLGKRSRIGVPLTWGAERRVAVELERKFRAAPSHASKAAPASSAASTRSTRCRTAAARYGRGRSGRCRWRCASAAACAGATSRSATSPRRALDLDDRLLASGVDVTLDTRTDPTFPRNAVYARAAWEHLDFEAQPARNRTTLEGRGFLGLFGSSVLALRATHGRADGALPPYEQWLLGGPSSVRGFSTGSEVGDDIVSGSIELRLPFSSPLRVAKTGVAVFLDRGAVWNDGQRLADADWKQGYGAGVFAIATVFQLRLDVAHGQGRGTRAHFSAGLSF